MFNYIKALIQDRALALIAMEKPWVVLLGLGPQPINTPLLPKTSCKVPILLLKYCVY